MGGWIIAEVAKCFSMCLFESLLASLLCHISVPNVIFLQAPEFSEAKEL